MSMSLGRLEVHECREDWECSHWPPVSRRWMCRGMCKNTQRNRERRRGNEEWEEGWVSETWGRGRRYLLLLLPLPCPSCSICFLTLMLSRWPFHSCPVRQLLLHWLQPDTCVHAVAIQSSYLISVTSSGWFWSEIFIFTTTDHWLSSSFKVLRLFKSIKLNIHLCYITCYISVS